MRRNSLAGLAFAAVLSAVPLAAASDAPQPLSAVQAALDGDAARIEAAHKSLEWNWSLPGRSGKYGHGETLIHAPLSAVRTRVLDFGHYKDMMSGHFEMSRVVGYGPDQSTDVYVRISVLFGLVKLWDVTRFGPVRQVGPGVEMLEGHMVRGNVDDMNAIWTMRSLGDDWTVLKLDLMLKPGLPAPQGAIDEAVRTSARHACDSIHDSAQGSRDIAPWP